MIADVRGSRMSARVHDAREATPSLSDHDARINCQDCKAPCSLRARIGCSSSAKPDRKQSQDSFRVGGGGTVFAISDGIGGSPNGALYSKVATNVVVDAYEGGSALDEAFSEAADAVERLGAWLNETGGTTLLAAKIDNGTATVAWVGDSEMSLLREGRLMRLTKHDRCPATERLSQALGGGRRFQTHMASVPLQAGDVLVLSTDGVWSELSEHEMKEYLQDARKSPAKAAGHLVTRRRQGRRKDDATAIVVALGAE